MFQNLF